MKNLQFKKNDGGRKKAFPKAKQRTGDCVIRAISIGTGLKYKKVWKDLFSVALETGMFPNSDEVSVTYLDKIGWERKKFGRNMFRIKELPRKGTFICHIRGHWVTVIDGVLQDTWDSRVNSRGDSSRVFSIYYKGNHNFG